MKQRYPRLTWTTTQKTK